MILGNPGKRVVRDPPKGVATNMLRTTASQYIQLYQYMYLFVFLSLHGSMENSKLFLSPTYWAQLCILLFIIAKSYSEILSKYFIYVNDSLLENAAK